MLTTVNYKIACFGNEVHLVQLCSWSWSLSLSKLEFDLTTRRESLHISTHIVSHRRLHSHLLSAQRCTTLLLHRSPPSTASDMISDDIRSRIIADYTLHPLITTELFVKQDKTLRILELRHYDCHELFFFSIGHARTREAESVVFRRPLYNRIGINRHYRDNEDRRKKMRLYRSQHLNHAVIAAASVAAAFNRSHHHHRCRRFDRSRRHFRPSHSSPYSNASNVLIATSQRSSSGEWQRSIQTEDASTKTVRSHAD